jgi:hypothetical protein
MPEITRFDVAQLGIARNAQLRMGDQHVEEKGTRPSWFGARAWNCLTRSNSEVDANKRLAEDFVESIRDRYGKDAGDRASTRLEAQRQKGRPLTAERVGKVIREAQAISNRHTAANDAVLSGLAERIFDDALRRITGARLSDAGWKLDGPSFKTLYDAMVREITSDPRFSRESFAGREDEFKTTFTSIAKRGMEREFDEKLMPFQNALRPGDRADAPPALEESTRYLNLIAGRLKKSHSESSSDAYRATLLECRAQLKSESAALTKLEVPPGSYVHRGALLEDIDVMVREIDRRLMLDKLDPQTREVLETALPLAVDVGQQVREGRWATLAKDFTANQEKLEAAHWKLLDLDPQATQSPGFVEYAKKAIEEARRGLGGLFTRDEEAALRDAGLGPEVGLEYKAKGLPINGRTMVGTLRDAKDPEMLRGGNICKPYAVTYETPTGPKRMVFKEAFSSQGYGGASLETGIDLKDPRMPLRSLATRAVDKRLEFGLIPDTQMGLMGGKLGMVIDFVPGTAPVVEILVPLDENSAKARTLRLAKDTRSPEQYQAMLAAEGLVDDGARISMRKHAGVSEIDFKGAGVRRELTKLQYLDALCGQADRHAKNYIVELDDRGAFVRLRGIDNDQAFGKAPHPNELVGPRTFALRLPQVIDTDMKAAFEKLTEDQLRADLAGLLTDAEIDAAVKRLGAIKMHIAKLPPECVIAPDAWGGPISSQQLKDQRAATSDAMRRAPGRSCRVATKR